MSDVEVLEIQESVSPVALKQLAEDASALHSRLNSIVTFRPVFVEFAGMPRAGKSSAIDTVKDFLEAHGFNVHAPGEGASQAPRYLREASQPHYNLWTMCYAIKEISESMFATSPKGYDFVLMDRGIFDALCWFHYLKERKRSVTEESRQAISNFLRADLFSTHLVFILAFLCEVGTGIEREERNRLFRREDRLVTNKEEMKALRATYESCAACYEGDFFAVQCIDTTRSESLKDTAYYAARLLLDATHRMLPESS